MAELQCRRNGEISFWQWLQIRCLYRAAFPRSERKPFGRILSLMKDGKSDVWCYELDGLFAGFATTINAEDLCLIDYLAVHKQQRGKGAGSAMLYLLKAHYSQGLFVEIESMYEPGEDQQERIRRKHFYTANGFVPMNVMADVFGVKMELLAWNGRLDFERYHAFYHDQYGAWAAEHILPADHPERGSD